MGLSLRNIAKKIYDDVNVFDHGKSQGNPTGAPRPKAPVQAQVPGRVPLFMPQQPRAVVKPKTFTSTVPLGNLNVNAPKPVVTAKPPVAGPSPELAQALLQGTKNKALNADPSLRMKMLAQANQPQPNKAVYIPGAFNDAVLKTAQDWTTRPAMEVIQTARDAINHGKPASYTPGSSVEKNIFGYEPVQSIQQKTVDQHRRDTQVETGYRHKLAGPLAAAEVAGSVINDVPVVGGAVKAVSKVTKAAAKLRAVEEITKSIPKSVPKSIPKTTKFTPPKLGQNTQQNLDQLVNQHIDAGPTNTNLRNPVTRALTKVQEKVYRQPVDVVRDKTNELIQKGLTSKNPVTSRVTAAPNVVFNRFGLSDEVRNVTRVRNGQQENSGRVIREVTNGIGQKMAALPDPQASLSNFQRYFFDKPTLERAFGKGTKKLPYSKLSPEEQDIVDQVQHIGKMRNNINYQIGNINKEQYLKGATGRHTPRIFDFETRTKGKNKSGGSLLDTGVKQKRKDISKFSDDTIEAMERNPIMAHMVRAEVALRDQATFDAMTHLEKKGLIRKNAPNKNFSRLDGTQYGKHNGKYIYNPIRSELDKHLAYNTQGGKAIGDLVDAYQNSWLGNFDRFFKSTKTTLSPGTFMGNVVSNPVAFNSAAGVNPLTQTKNMVKAAVKLHGDKEGNFDKSLYEARAHGVGVDDTGKQLTGDRRKENLSVDIRKTKNPVKKASAVYGGVDRAAQIALYDELRARGLDPVTAARRVQLGTQDYGGAGRLIQNLADAPVLGKPFARFTPELLRLTKNNLLYNPVGTGAKLAGVAAGEQALSHLSGETDDERNARENATGQTQLPGTAPISRLVTGRDANVSLNLPIGGSSVNIARLTGLNYPIDPGGDAKSAAINQASPFALPYRRDAQGNVKLAPNEAVSSLTFRPIADQLANRDFMGRSITDPDNKTYVEGVGDKGKKYVSNLPKSEQNKNRGRTLASQYVPLFNEGNAVLAATGKKKDYYGKERTVPQAALRAVGIKVEANDKKARQDRLDTQQYFEGRVNQVNDFLRKNPELKDAYTKIQSKTVDRKNNTRVNDIISPEKWKIMDAHPQLYGQLKKEAEYDNQHSKDTQGKGKPVDPIYKLSDPIHVNEIMRLRSLPTGDDQERKEILKATSSWYNQFNKDEDNYYKANDDYYAHLKKNESSTEPPKTNPRQAAYNNIKYPTQSSLIGDYYTLKDKDPTAAKNFYKAHADELSKNFSDYKDAQLTYTNAKREIEGADPISKDVWDSVTFGYETDDKAAKELASKNYSAYSSGSSKKKVSYSDPHATDIARGSKDAWRKIGVKSPATPGKAKVRSRVSKAKVSMKVTKSKV